MPFGHEQLDVYQLSLRYVSWAYAACRASRQTLAPTAALFTNRDGQFADHLELPEALKRLQLLSELALKLQIIAGIDHAAHPNRRKSRTACSMASSSRLASRQIGN